MEKILCDLLNYYLSFKETLLEKHLKEVNTATKERVDTIGDLQVIIYSNDHNPLHFYVKTKNLNIDTKSKNENCKLISGDISSKDLKKIKAFYTSTKGKIILNTIWNKRN